ncbi:MAG: tRNA uridine(34) 5-carboxymethylaminomethyl modification radical SAM/GNAT enzyme Elp3 [archaeon]|nr:tRNA uridine(34) 5-carboxymethylaminomethyl modification radical SAM/GNAT enzyme Elp3 [archaeon]
MKTEEEKVKEISRDIIDHIIAGKIASARKLDYEKRKLSKKHNLIRILKNSEILHYARKHEKEKVKLLVKKPVRSISGVSIVAIMSKPSSCPGKCIYCPQGDNAPKSYTGLEPAARRAIMFDYDPYRQTKNRTRQLKAIGHSIDKIELIIMGGTFPSCSKKYQEWFTKRCFDALNQKESTTLKEAQKLNETTSSRCVGLTIETRPDYCTQKHIDQMLKLGTTRVELGVQTLSDSIYKKVNRGHTIRDVKEATCALKDSALKILYHMMPGLFQDEKKDLKMFDKLFKNPDFRPDMLKIYPVLVIKGTGLYKMYREKKYTPLTNETAKILIAKAMQKVPPYVRIMRCQRDIPKEKIVAGPTAGNLREMAEEFMDDAGMECRCIRCHEAGHLCYKKGITPQKIELNIEKYTASGGTEYFITLEDKKQKNIVGFLRLRMPSRNPKRKEIDKNTALIRELKVFGTALELKKRNSDSFQHKGIGKRLMEEGELLAKKDGATKILVISAIGTREYYRKLGYTGDGPYLSKKI